MLTTLRKGAASWVAKILFGILVLSFAVWGIGDIFRGPGRDSVAISVGDQDITGAELLAEFRRDMAQLSPAFRGILDTELARKLGYLEGVIQRLATRALFESAAADLGLAVSDTVVRNLITSDPNFYGPTGSFDKFTFQQILRSAGYTEESYIAALRKDFAREQLVAPIQASAWAPEIMVDALYRLRQERRVFDTVAIAADAMTGVGEPSEAELVDFHRTHADRFTAPEYRALTAIHLAASDFTKEIEIPEEELRAAYDDNRSRFVIPERRTVRQMLLADEESARRAHDMLAAGRDFAEVANELTGGEEGDLDLGVVTKEALPPDLAEAAFQLGEGAFSAPIESSLGWHILEVTKIAPGVTRSFEEARAELHDELAEELALDSLYSIANKLEDELAGGAGLKEAARRLNLKVVTMAAMDRDGRDASGREISPLPGEKFRTVAFQTGEGQESLLTETPEGAYFILRVDKVTPAALRPLESVRNEVAAAWKDAARRRKAEARAKEIVERVEAGATLAAVAADLGLEVTTQDPVLRDDRTLPPGIVSQLFEARPGALAAAAIDDGHMVAQLREIQPAKPGSDKAGVKAVEQDLRSAMARDLLEQYGAALLDRYTVKINRRTIDSLF